MKITKEIREAAIEEIKKRNLKNIRILELIRKGEADDHPEVIKQYYILKELS